jgi:hypothetical protein
VPYNFLKQLSCNQPAEECDNSWLETAITKLKLHTTFAMEFHTPQVGNQSEPNVHNACTKASNKIQVRQFNQKTKEFPVSN